MVFKKMKKINTHTSSKFHKWRINLSNKLSKKGLNPNYIIQDFDTLCINDGKILAYVEIKRSFYNLIKWYPFKADYNNYKALFELSKKTNSQLWVFYKQKNANILKQGLSIFLMNDVSNFKFDFEKKIFSFKEFNEFLLSHDIGSSEFKVESYKDSYLEKDEENIYFILSKYFKNNFYFDNNNTWSMIISDTIKYLPKLLYIEIIIDDVDAFDFKDFKDNMIYQLSKKLNVPFWIIGYLKEFDKIYLLNKDGMGFKTVYNMNDFETIYIPYLMQK